MSTVDDSAQSESHFKDVVFSQSKNAMLFDFAAKYTHQGSQGATRSSSFAILVVVSEHRSPVAKVDQAFLSNFFPSGLLETSLILEDAVSISDILVFLLYRSSSLYQALHTVPRNRNWPSFAAKERTCLHPSSTSILNL